MNLDAQDVCIVISKMPYNYYNKRKHTRTTIIIRIDAR